MKDPTMLRTKYFVFLLLFMVIPVLGGCHLEQGKLHFDEFGLDPITVYKMEPLEVAVYCLAESDISSHQQFSKLFDLTLSSVMKNPKNNDWGKLACLGLSERATRGQMKRTVDVFDNIIAARSGKDGPAKGFRALIWQRLHYENRLAEEEEKIRQMTEMFNEERKIYEKEMTDDRERSEMLELKIEELTKQMQKLKDVELLLKPKLN